MKINCIRNFVKALFDSKREYTVIHTSKSEKHKNNIQQVPSFSFKFSKNLVLGFFTGQDFDLTDNDIEFLKDIIPDDSFSDYIHYKGVFYFINYGLKRAIITDKSKIDFGKIKVFDWTHAAFDSLGKNVRAAYDLIENALDDYDNSCIYDPNNYTIVKEVPVDISPTFDINYSLTKDQTEAMREWQNKHYNKYHKNYAKMQKSVSPMSIFSVKFESCSIGSWANCICSKCMEAADTETNEKKKEKLKKQGTYEIFSSL